MTKPPATYHGLLPLYLQSLLKQAAATKSMAAIDEAVVNCMEMSPRHFHTTESLDSRIFYNAPAQRIPMIYSVMP